MIAATIAASKAAWYLTRGTGIVSLLLLTSVTVLGILNSVRWAPGRSPRFVLQHLHRNLSLLSVVFIVLHVTSAVLDSFAPIRWLDAVVPFAATYRPIWLGLGAVAFDLLLAVTITSLLRTRIGFGSWRVVHGTSYACWGVAVFHGIGVGSDPTQPWMVAFAGVMVASVVAATAWRIASGWRAWTPARTALAAGLLVVPVAIGVLFVLGPMRPGWAARAGTPQALLFHAPAPAPAPSATTVAASKPTPPLILPPNANGAGTTQVRRLPGGQARVDIALHASGDPAYDVKVVLNGAQAGAGVSLSNGSAILTPPRGAEPYQGSVTGLSGGTIVSDLSDGHGDEITLTLQLQILAGGRTVAQFSIAPVSSAATNGGSV